MHAAIHSFFLSFFQKKKKQKCHICGKELVKLRQHLQDVHPDREFELLVSPALCPMDECTFICDERDSNARNNHITKKHKEVREQLKSIPWIPVQAKASKAVSLLETDRTTMTDEVTIKISGDEELGEVPGQAEVENSESTSLKESESQVEVDEAQEEEDSSLKEVVDEAQEEEDSSLKETTEVSVPIDRIPKFFCCFCEVKLDRNRLIQHLKHVHHTVYSGENGHQEAVEKVDEMISEHDKKAKANPYIKLSVLRSTFDDDVTTVHKVIQLLESRELAKTVHDVEWPLLTEMTIDADGTEPEPLCEEASIRYCGKEYEGEENQDDGEENQDEGEENQGEESEEGKKEREKRGVELTCSSNRKGKGVFQRRKELGLSGRLQPVKGGGDPFMKGFENYIQDLPLKVKKDPAHKAEHLIAFLMKKAGLKGKVRAECFQQKYISEYFAKLRETGMTSDSFKNDLTAFMHLLGFIEEHDLDDSNDFHMDNAKVRSLANWRKKQQRKNATGILSERSKRFDAEMEKGKIPRSIKDIKRGYESDEVRKVIDRIKAKYRHTKERVSESQESNTFKDYLIAAVAEGSFARPGVAGNMTMDEFQRGKDNILEIPEIGENFHFVIVREHKTGPDTRANGDPAPLHISASLYREMELYRQKFRHPNAKSKRFFLLFDGREITNASKYIGLHQHKFKSLVKETATQVRKWMESKRYVLCPSREVKDSALGCHSVATTRRHYIGQAWETIVKKDFKDLMIALHNELKSDEGGVTSPVLEDDGRESGNEATCPVLEDDGRESGNEATSPVLEDGNESPISSCPETNVRDETAALAEKIMEVMPVKPHAEIPTHDVVVRVLNLNPRPSKNVLKNALNKWYRRREVARSAYIKEKFPELRGESFENIWSLLKRREPKWATELVANMVAGTEGKKRKTRKRERKSKKKKVTEGSSDESDEERRPPKKKKENRA